MTTYQRKSSINSSVQGAGWIKAGERVLGDSTSNANGVANRPSKLMSDNIDLVADILASGWSIKDDDASAAKDFLVARKNATSSASLPSSGLTPGSEIRVANAKPNGHALSITGTGLTGVSLEYGDDWTFAWDGTNWSGRPTQKVVSLPTQADTSNDFSPATTAFVARAVRELVDSADSSRDTLRTLYESIVDNADASRNTLRKLADAIRALENNVNKLQIIRCYRGTGSLTTRRQARTDIGTHEDTCNLQNLGGTIVPGVSGASFSSDGLVLPAGTWLFQPTREYNTASWANAVQHMYLTYEGSTVEHRIQQSFADTFTGSRTYRWKLIGTGIGYEVEASTTLTKLA